ncbi:MAG: hypothetical protein ACOYMN_21840 [Roseimicrobium sp.]
MDTKSSRPRMRALLQSSLATFFCIFNLACSPRSRPEDEQLHRSVFEQISTLRFAVIEYQNSNGRPPLTSEEIQSLGDNSRRCHLASGVAKAWRVNQSPRRDDDWLFAAPICTEHDGMKGVWVMTKNLSLQVWDEKRLP